MTGSHDIGACAYTARKEDPANWHGDAPDDWVLDSEAPLGLEQEIWECPHEALDGSEYCAFHTDPEDVPNEVDEGELFVEAVNEASAIDDEETARRTKEFVGASFGTFDIKGATLDANDEHPIRLDHATFAKGVLADDAVFEHGVLATRVRFETGDEALEQEIGRVSFSGAEFSGDGNVLFLNAEFGGDGEVVFSGAEFSGDGDVSFTGAEFCGDGRVSFTGAEFGGDGRVLFEHTEFSGDGRVSFIGAEFSGDGNVSFRNAEFGGDGRVLFEHAEFSGEGNVSFTGAEFCGDGRVSFIGAEFSGDGRVLFEYAEFSGEGNVSFESAMVATFVSFLNTKFGIDSTAVFSNVEFRDSVTFGPFDDEAIPYVQHSLDFSDATFHRRPDFRGRTASITRTEQSDSGKPQFDLVFASEVDFTGARFENGVDFSTTRFLSDADFTDTTLEDADFSGADVTGTVDVSETSFDGANLTDANFSDATLTGASFERARLNRAELLGTNLSGTKLYGALLGDARINRETTFWLDATAERRESADGRLPVRALRGVKNTLRRGPEPYCAYDPRYRGPEGDPDLGKAAEVYGTLETLARQNSLPGLASECFLGRKDVQLREYWHDDEPWMVFRSLVPSVVARYGESPGRVLGTSAIVIATCGLIYYVFDLIERAGPSDSVTLFESFYFSALTFTTLGYGDFNPSNSAGQVLAVVETSIGVILLAVLVFVFGRRATR